MGRFNTVSRILSAIGLFGALLYFVGRRYIESYYAVLSVPIERTNLGYADYAYYGAQPLQVLIPALFTLLGIRLLVIIFPRQKERTTTIERDNKAPTSRQKLNIKTLCRNMMKELKIFWNGIKNRHTFSKMQETFLFFYFIYMFIAIGYSLLWIVGLQQLHPATNLNDLKINTYASLMIVFFFVYFAIWFYFNNAFSELIQIHKKVREIFLVCGVISLLLFPYITGGSYGTLQGINALQKPQQTFKTVTLVAQSEISDLTNWVPIDDNKEESKDNYLIYEGEEYLFIKSQKDINQTIVIAKSSLIFYSIQNPATLEKPPVSQTTATPNSPQ